MRKILNHNENGFTLIEMMIVLLVISIILLIALPNVTKQSSSINEKGCDALEQIIEFNYNLYFEGKF
ncbi:competence type IV pilus major pilin ComGC [Lederbergia citri]|uniref:Prepilin-type N-terminal cleavage/methylation domain-containing protein n=1 Tax=Lederbergia citri TaxID=2833580 RepID=A0A942YGG8_9BACI|nr:competence type IV pilus major pilin ComGC [Lederbergia citri]MBS4194674.1 prepilin-type N-terminal cleavage/methylation domain-containing protein [Lederbergia citri]